MPQMPRCVLRLHSQPPPTGAPSEQALGFGASQWEGGGTSRRNFSCSGSELESLAMCGKHPSKLCLSDNKRRVRKPALGCFGSATRTESGRCACWERREVGLCLVNRCSGSASALLCFLW